MVSLRKSLVYLLIFTAVSAFVAYKLVVEAYSGTYAHNDREEIVDTLD